jgi:hypothetical protein
MAWSGRHVEGFCPPHVTPRRRRKGGTDETGACDAQKATHLGGYDFTEEDELSRMAMDITKVVQGFLRFSSGENYGASDLQANELAAAGEVLCWAQEYLAWHGLRGDKELNAAVRKWQDKQKGEQRARRRAR